MPIAERALRNLSLDGFRDPGMPERVAPVDLATPAGRQYVLRMAIRADGVSAPLPAELAWVQPMLDVALEHQAAIGVDHPFCYVTVRHGLVESETDDEWHVDGFSTKVPHVPEQNYIWCSHTGTECASIHAEFPKDFDPLAHNVNHFLAPLVDPDLVEACEPGVVHCLDPFLLHRRPVGTAGTVRTFVRISFVPIEINDVNNAQNPALPRHYDRDGVAFRERLATYGA